MDSIEAKLAALLALSDREPDTRFARAVELRIAAEHRLATRLAAERSRTASLLAATVAVAAGLWLLAQSGAFSAASDTAGGSVIGFAAVAAVMLLWLGTGAMGSLASD